MFAKNKSELSEAKNDFEMENYLKYDSSIWQKRRKSSNNLTHLKIDDSSVKSNIFIPKKHKLEIYQKEKLKDLTIDTQSSDNFLRKNNSNLTSDLSAEEKDFAYGKSNRNSITYLEIQNSNISNSSFSTAYNSLCSTPISSPDSDVKKTLNVNPENLIHMKNSFSNKNLYECYYENSTNKGYNNMNINDTFRICHINSFCTKSEVDSKKNSPQNFNINDNFNFSSGNKSVFNSKVNSVNNNSSSNLNSDNKLSSSEKPVYALNPHVYYDTTKIANNSLININHVSSPIYNNSHNFCQMPIYQNQIYFNNFNISVSAPSYIPKKSKYSFDPLNALREQTNSMIRTSNGKAVPFEEPHNRINLENVIKALIKNILNDLYILK